MGNADYEERRKQEAARRDADERKFKKREAQEVAAEALFDVMLPALKDFFEARACLTIEAGTDGKTLVRFQRG